MSEQGQDGGQEKQPAVKQEQPSQPQEGEGNVELTVFVEQLLSDMVPNPRAVFASTVVWYTVL